MIQQQATNFKAMCVMPVSKNMDELSLHDFTTRGKWVVLFYFPFSFTFVCPTEIISFSDRQPEFEALNCQLIAASCDSTQSHIAWSNLPRNEGGLGDLKIPIISDFDKQIAKAYGVLLPDGTPLRGTFIISPSGIIRHTSINDLSVGRSVDEIIRLVSAFQHTDEFGELCPANWQPGDSTIKANSTQAMEYFHDTVDGKHGTADSDVNYTRVKLASVNARNTNSYHYNSDVTTRTFCDHTKTCFAQTLRKLQSIVTNGLDSYKSALQTAPLRTKATSSMIIALLGELIAASIKAQKTKSKRGSICLLIIMILFFDMLVVLFLDMSVIIDFRRVAIFGVYGLAITGPFFHWWYGFLERSVASLQLKQPNLSFAVKLATNQLVMTPPVLLFTLLYIQYFLTLDWSKTVQTVKRTYAVALFTNWKVWTAAQAINFQVVPLDYRVLFGNVVALWWNTYLSVTSAQ